MKRIGILGGTFNPIHIGHLAMADIARDRCQLDQVIFVPCFQPPHKSMPHLVGARDRYNMVRLAIQDRPDFAVTDVEIKRKGKSYSIDTVTYLRALYPRGTRLFFIIGEDNLVNLDKWKKIDEMIRIVTFIVINRPGQTQRGPEIKHLAVQMPGIDISASYLRRCIRNGQSVRYLIPERVRKFIITRKLYQA